MREQCRDAVVVTEADLVVRDGIVLVHDGHAAELEQPFEGLARVEILPPVDEVVRNQQNLSRHQTEGTELRVVDLHESALPGRGQSLQGPHVGWALGQSERGHSGRHRTRRHQHDVVAGCPQFGDLPTGATDHRTIDDPPGIGERRCSDLHDDETTRHDRPHRSGL